MGKKSISTALAAILLAGALPALAASVSGVLLESGGKRVAGITVIALNAQGATQARAVSSADGEYTLSVDPDANYRFAIDTASTGFRKGDPVGAFVPRNGLTLNWILSSTASPLAYARPAPATQVAAGDPVDPPLIPQWAALVLGSGIVAGGTVGGVAAAGGFSGGTSHVASSSK